MPTLDDLFSEKPAKAKPELNQLVLDTASKYQLEPGLLHAMIRQESGGNPQAVSPKGAQGLMQIMPATAQELGVTDPMDPAQNLDAGARYIKQQIDKYGDIPKALAAYNFGPGNVDKGKPLPKETQQYVQNITSKAGIKQASPTLDQLFADEGTAPKSGINPVPDKRGESIRSAAQMAIPATAVVATMPLTAGMSLPAVYGTEALASLGAEGLLQATGISDRDNAALIGAAAAPGVGRGAAGLLAGIPKLIPGFSQGVRAALTPLSKELPAKILPGGDSKALYSAIQGNMKTVLPEWPNLGKTVAELGEKVDNIPWQQLQAQTKGTGLDALFGQIEQSLKGTPATITKQPPVSPSGASLKGTGLPSQPVTTPAKPAGLTFDEARAAIEGFNKVIRTTSDDTLRGNYMQLKKAMLTDLENMPPLPGTPVQQWREARQAYRLEKTRGLLSDAVERNTVNKEGVEQFNPDGMLKWLRNNDEIKQRLSDTEMRQLTNTLKDWAGASSATKNKLVAVVTGAFATGGPGGALMGYLGSEAMGKAFLSDGSQRIIRKMLTTKSGEQFRNLSSMLTASLRGAFDEPGPTKMPEGF